MLISLQPPTSYNSRARKSYNGAVDGILAFASGHPENIVNPEALRA